MYRYSRKNLEVLRSAIVLDKINLEFAENVKYKPTGNNSVFITYSNTINVDSEYLDNIGYLINKLFFCKRTGYHMVEKIGKNKKVIKAGKTSGKYYILTVE